MIFRVGQKIRMEWPNGDAIEGTLNNGRLLQLPNSSVFYNPHATGDGVIVTVLSNPRPDEPTGFGAVVEAQFKSDLCKNENRKRFVRRPLTKRNATTNQFWVSEDAQTYSSWEDLYDPVVLFEGL